VLAHRKGPAVLIGAKPAGAPEPNVEFAASEGPEAMWCGVYGAEPAVEPCAASDEREALPEDVMGLPEPYLYFDELRFGSVPPEFVRACAEVIRECSGAPRVLRRPEAIQVEAMELEDGRWRVILGNQSHYYVVTELDMGREIGRTERVTPFPGSPPAFEGSQLTCRVPGRGAVMFDVWLKQA
jgi:hypothetical protein